MALDLDGEVPDELVAVLDAVFEEEAVADDVVGHVVLDAQEVRAVHGHAAVVGVVDATAFLMYWPFASPTRCQWIG